MFLKLKKKPNSNGMETGNLVEWAYKSKQNTIKLAIPAPQP